jgi:hypothetical protein
MQHSLSPIIAEGGSVMSEGYTRLRPVGDLRIINSAQQSWNSFGWLRDHAPFVNLVGDCVSGAAFDRRFWL